MLLKGIQLQECVAKKLPIMRIKNCRVGCCRRLLSMIVCDYMTAKINGGGAGSEVAVMRFCLS